MKYSAIIFDLDGTLLDTLNHMTDAMNAVLAHMQLPQHTIQYYRQYIGHGINKEFVKISLPENFQQSDIIDSCYQNLIIEYIKIFDNKTKLYNGIAELLDTLQHKQIPLAILSNKEHQFMPQIMQTYFNQWVFKIAFGARENVPLKPHPQAACEIANIFGYEPQHIAFIGDSEIDMQTAVAEKCIQLVLLGV